MLSFDPFHADLLVPAKCSEEVREGWVLTDRLLSWVHILALCCHTLFLEAPVTLRLRAFSSCRRVLSLHLGQPGGLGT